MDIKDLLRMLIQDYWSARGIRIGGHKSNHRAATHQDLHSKAARDKRKTRRKMARASRKGNR